MVKKYVLIIGVFFLIAQTKNLSAMNWWPTALTWGGSYSTPSANNNNNNNSCPKIKPIIGYATKYMNEYSKRSEGYFYKKHKDLTIWGISVGKDIYWVGSKVDRIFFDQNWQDEKNHESNVLNAFNQLHDEFCKDPSVDQTKGIGLTLVVLLESKFIIAHAGTAGFVLKKDTQEAVVSKKHHICLNTAEKYRINTLGAYIQTYANKLIITKIRHDHNTDSYTIYYPSWEFYRLFDDYDSSTEIKPLSCKSKSTEFEVCVFFNLGKALFEVITRGIGYSAFTPYITHVPEIFAYDSDGKEDFLILAGQTTLDCIEPSTLAIFVEKEIRSRGETSQTVTQDQACEIAESIINQLAEFAPNKDLTLIIIFFSI
jgi:serine/threonine protein phosphatase PrpC